MEKVKKAKSIVLQVGESTHTHVLTSEKNITYNEVEGGAMTFELEAPGVLTHEEHGTMVFKKGTYFKFPQLEWDPLSKDMRQVFD